MQNSVPTAVIELVTRRGSRQLPLGGMVGREADGPVQRVGVRSSVIPHSPMGG
ncbi:hypothetical protein [Mycobacterium kansasii]|uniref:hypothetical protein n=1 Tax=Mycobacterium kansasii TaxID=1768 RepID=UPI0015E24F4F|nr:hypothetical protein [Mycobacterium kansasii]